MAKQLVNIGTTVNDGTGDTLRVSFNKINENTTELYNSIDSLISLDIPTSFYIDAITGIDGSNDGLTPLTAFNSLIYCLIHIRDTYILNTQISIELITDIVIEGNYSLRGFTLGKTDLYPLLTIKSYQTSEIYGDTSLYKTVRISNTSNQFSLSGLSLELSLEIISINFSNFSGTNSASFNLDKCDNVTFYNVNSSYVIFNFTECSDLYIAGASTQTNSITLDDEDFYFILDNSQFRFNRCLNPSLSSIDIKNNSLIEFRLCHSAPSNQLKYFLVSGVRTASFNNVRYFSFFECTGFGMLYEIILRSLVMTGSFVYLNDCFNFDFNHNFIKSSSIPSVSFTGSGYFYEVTNSTNINLVGGATTKFINAIGNRALLVDNLSEISTTITTTSILNLPVVSLVNNVGTESFINSSNYRSTSGLLQTTQSAAIDELSLLTKIIINSTIFIANGTALNNNINLVNTTAARTITAPTTTITNSKFIVVDVTGNASTNNITVAFTGSRLFSVVNDTFIINVNKASITFIYVNSTIGWITI